MRVLIVTQYFWPESFRLNELVNSLSEKGCEITVLTGQPNYPEGKTYEGYKPFRISRQEHNGYKVVRIPLVPRGKSGAIRLMMNYLSFVLGGLVFSPWLLRRKKFDVIFVYAISPILAAIPAILLKKLKKAALVTWVGDLWPDSLSATGYVKNESILKLVSRLVAWIYGKNDLILGQSRTFVEPIRQLLKKDNVTVDYFPNPGETIYSSAVKYPPAIVLKDGFNVVYAGNLGTVQALEIIIDAAELIKSRQDINIYLLGSGSLGEWLNKEIISRSLENVFLPGRFEPECMPAIFEQADALIVSLVKDKTMAMTVPAKIQTYLAVGKPVIAALDGEGARIVIEAGAGVASEAGNAQALADAILKLKNLSPVERKQMGENGQKYFKANFDPSLLTEKLIDIFKTLKK